MDVLVSKKSRKFFNEDVVLGLMVRGLSQWPNLSAEPAAVHPFKKKKMLSPKPSKDEDVFPFWSKSFGMYLGR
jgi:hypothetical protein